MPIDPSSPSGPEKCPNCGTILPEQAPQGLCPKCLFAGLALPTADGPGTAPQAPAQTPEELAPHFPQLEIIECLGRGGMGVVYKARQKTLNRLVALKLLAPERANDPQFAVRFEKEAQALAALNHPHIVTIHDHGQAGGFYYLLMEFVDGVNLRQAMKAGRFTPEQALAVVPPVCEALQYAHEHGIVHRDIKPENLLLDKEGRVKIADFGIAKMLGESGTGVPPVNADTTAGTLASVAGTPQYMAPEQKTHGVTDHRADIYSLGVVLYELLTGELPADSLQPPSRKVQIDVRLDEIVLRALEKTPELRYQTAVEFRTQVETMVSTPRGGGRSEEAQTQKSEARNPKPEIPPRFSRTAIAGACWVPFFFAALLMYFTVKVVSASPSENHESRVWLALLTFVLGGLGLTAPFGTTILGWVAVTQIRRSAGKLYGMGLAVFDGLLFPLLVFDLVGIKLVGVVVELFLRPRAAHSETARYLYHDAPLIIFIPMIAVFLLLDWLIIRRVWRAVNRPLGTALPTDIPPNSSAASGNDRSTLGKWAFGLFLTGVLGTPLLLALLPQLHLKEAPALLFGGAALLLSLIFGLMSRRDRFGRIAVIGNGVLSVLACVAFVVFFFKARADREYQRNARNESLESQEQIRDRATHPFLRVTVRILETHSGFDTSKLLRPASLLDDGEVKVLAAPSLAVRSGDEIGIQLPEFPLLFKGGSHILSGRTKTLYVTPTLEPGSAHVRYTMEGDVRGEGAKAGSRERLSIRSGSLQLGEWQLMESKGDGGRKQLAVLSVEMEAPWQPARFIRKPGGYQLGEGSIVLTPSSDGKVTLAATMVEGASRDTTTVPDFCKKEGWFVYIENPKRVWIFDGIRQLDLLTPGGIDNADDPSIRALCPQAVWDAVTESGRKINREPKAKPAAPQAPFQTMSDHPPTSRRTSLDIRISATARSVTPVSLTHKNDKTDTLVLPIVIENRSQKTITADLAREWYGGLWPPTCLGAAVRRLDDPAAQWRISEVYLVGEEGNRNEPTTLQPGQSNDFQLRMNWAGTVSKRAVPLMETDKPGKYAVKLSLVFKSEAVLEYFESDEMEVTVEAKAGPPPDSSLNQKQFEEVLKESQNIKEGVTREELLKTFATEGGISTATSRTFVHRRYPYIKIDVEFTPSDPKQNPLEERPADTVKKVTRPYLERSIVDSLSVTSSEPVQNAPAKAEAHDAIDRLVAKLSATTEWENGAYKPIELPESATAEQLVGRVFQTTSPITANFKQIEARKVEIPNGLQKNYLAVLCQTGATRKIVLLQFQNGGWWNRVYDADETAKTEPPPPTAAKSPVEQAPNIIRSQAPMHYSLGVMLATKDTKSFPEHPVYAWPWVKSPGAHPFTDGMTVADLIFKAGGLVNDERVKDIPSEYRPLTVAVMRPSSNDPDPVSFVFQFPLDWSKPDGGISSCDFKLQQGDLVVQSMSKVLPGKDGNAGQLEKSALPAEEPAKADPPSPSNLARVEVITIAADGALTVAGEPCPAGELAERVKKLAAWQPSSVEIRADAKTPSTQVSTVMKACEAAGIRCKLGLAERH